MNNIATHKGLPHRGSLMAWLVLLGSPMIGSSIEAQTLHRLDSTDLDHVYAKADVDLSEYRQILIDPVDIWYASSTKLNEDQLDEKHAGLRSQFREIIEAALERDGYEIVNAPASGVMRLQVALIDLKTIEPGTAENPFRDRYRFNTAHGGITLIADLRDSVTGEVLMRVAHLERGPMNSSMRVATVSDEVHQVFTSWSTTLSDTLATLPTVNASRAAQLSHRGRARNDL